MKRILFFLMAALVVSAVCLAQGQDEIRAEAYAYGNYLGTVQVDDLTTDGQSVFLKGIQVWPELKSQDKALPTVEESTRQKGSLRNQVIDEQIRLQRNKQDSQSLCDRLIELFEASPLVTSANRYHDDYCIEIYWTGDPYPEYFEIIDTTDRPTQQERLNDEMTALQIYIQRNYTLVIGFGVRQGLPPSLRAEVQAEISAAQNGTWNGKGLLDPATVEQFRSPMDIEIH